MLQNHEIRNKKRRNVTSLHQENYKIDTPPPKAGKAAVHPPRLPAISNPCRLRLPAIATYTV